MVGTNPSVSNLAQVAVSTGVRFEWLATGRGHPSSTLSVRNRIDFVALTEQRRGFRGQKNRKPCGGTPYSLSKHLTASFV